MVQRAPAGLLGLFEDYNYTVQALLDGGFIKYDQTIFAMVCPAAAATKEMACRQMKQG